MNKKILLLFLILIFGYIFYKKFLPNCKFCPQFQSIEQDTKTQNFDKENRASALAKIKTKAHEIKRYAVQHKLNTHFGFLLNMQQPSGQKRFYVYDLQKDKILDNGLVAHGSGDQLFAELPKYSNENGSGLTSLGKYKIGSKYDGQFGTAYKLHGLETSNSNAFSRFIVLHSYSCVPNDELYPNHLCNSLGCAMVNKNFLQKLSHFIDTEKIPIVLWVFE